MTILLISSMPKDISIFTNYRPKLDLRNVMKPDFSKNNLTLRFTPAGLYGMIHIKEKTILF